MTLGWLLAVAVPLVAVLWLGQRTDALAQWLFFLAALASGLCVWVLGLAPPFVGALMALVLMDQALRHRAQCGDVGVVAPRIG